MALSMALWLVDNYYDSYFQHPGAEASEKQYAFQNVLWEIFGDGGTPEGLDFGTGNINRSSSISMNSPTTSIIPAKNNGL